MRKGLDSLCTIGQKMADITVPATVRRRSGDGIVSRQGRVRLSRLKNTAVIFHTEGCPVCKAETEAADTLLLRKGRISALTEGCGSIPVHGTFRPRLASGNGKTAGA